MKLIDKALSNQLGWVPFGIEFVWLKVADCLIKAVHGGGLWVSHVGRKFSSGSFGLFSHLNSFKYWFLKQSTTLTCDVVAQYIMKMQDGNIFKWWFPVAPASASMHLSLVGSVYFSDFYFPEIPGTMRQTSASFMVSQACEWDSHYSLSLSLSLSLGYDNRWSNRTSTDFNLEAHILLIE